MEDDFKVRYLEIGTLLCKERKVMMLTQQQLADKVDKLDRAKISDIENGKEDFYFSTILKIFAALDLEVEIKVRPKKTK
jgi:predicted transcriptional regulator